YPASSSKSWEQSSRSRTTWPSSHRARAGLSCSIQASAKRMDSMKRTFGMLVRIGLLAMSGCLVDAREASVEEFDLTHDPFLGEMPEIMRFALEEQRAGRELALKVQRELFNYTRSHPQDARPWLLLARDSMARDSGGFAERQYGSALRADAQVVHV